MTITVVNIDEFRQGLKMLITLLSVLTLVSL